MAEDGRFEFKGGLISRTIDNANEYATRGWNWMLTGQGFGVVKYLYMKAFGKEDDPDKMREWATKYLKNSVLKDTDLDKWLDENFTNKSATQYKYVLKAGAIDPSGIKYVETPGDSIYVVSDANITNVAGNEQAIADAIKAAEQKATGYLKGRYPDIADNIYKFVEISGGTRVVENSTFKIFIRMPLPGTPEYAQKSIGVQKPPAYEERRNIEIFGPNNKIEYSKLEPNEQERLRIRFLMDAGQTVELEKICDWFTRKYRTQNMTIKGVTDRLFKDDDDRKKALEETGASQGLNSRNHILAALEGQIEDIEKDAAKDVRGASTAYMEMVEQMRISHGYKVRLALLGDSAAKAFCNFDPNKDGATDKLLKDYKERCKQFVKDKNEGRF
jgi:hypothetical protein